MIPCFVNETDSEYYVYIHNCLAKAHYNNQRIELNIEIDYHFMAPRMNQIHLKKVLRFSTEQITQNPVDLTSKSKTTTIQVVNNWHSFKQLVGSGFSN